jgi:hypothetical protein
LNNRPDSTWGTDRDPWGRFDRSKKTEDFHEMIRMLDEPDVVRRRSLWGAIVSHIARWGDETTVPVLIEVAKSSPDPGPRVSAAAGLARHGGREVERTLVELLKDDDHRVRTHAAIGLATATSEDAARALAETLRDPRVTVRRAAAVSLAQAPADTRVAIDPLVAALEDGNPFVRRSASRALALIGAQSALPALRRARNRTWPPWRFAMSRDIEYLESQAAE